MMAVVALPAGIIARAWLLEHPPRRLSAENFRGSRVFAIGGTAVLIALVFGEVIGLGATSRPRIMQLMGIAGPSAVESVRGKLPLTALTVATGFYLLGLLDDLVGDPRSRGLAGHFRALVGGVLTTGTVKAVGGLALALGAGWWIEMSFSHALLDALLIALAANLVNLLDLRPGRAVKAFLILWLPLAVTLLIRNHPLAPVLASAGSAAGAWLPADLGERGMLGDSGSNMLGAILGAGGAWAFGTGSKLLLLALVAAATLCSERWSFTKVIERVAPLRWFDDLGRLPRQ
jgi:UDP-GlcNAc:undecaprenyl-phosphate/decaprenyl-phosphate GlcNAc-1-phosphate transferase